MGYFVDYISFTLKLDTEIPGIALAYFYKYINLEIEECEVGKGLNGYKQGCYFPSGIKIFFDGMPGMGIHVVISGLGLKSEHLNFNLFELIEKLKADGMQYNISRIDVALDTEKDFGYFLNKFRRKQFVCKYKDTSCKQYVDSNNRGTLYFGKRGGLTMFRIYDKALEQKIDDKIWTRIEMECRDEACEQIIEALKNDTVKNYFLGHLKFVNKRLEKVERSVVSMEYLKVLENPNEPIKVKRKESDKTMEWFEAQVAPTVKAIIRDYGLEYVAKVIERSKISKKQMKERFGLHVVNGQQINQSGEIDDIPTSRFEKLSVEYIQQCIKEVS